MSSDHHLRIDLPATSARIRAVIVDDEPLAREAVRNYLKEDPAVEIAGEAGDGDSAVALIRNVRPDLLFLDVQMPKMDGFDVLSALEETQIPVTVFVTAYDRYALKAFEEHALDYLVKPFNRKRFQRALDRAKQQIRQARTSDCGMRLLALLKEQISESRYPNRVSIRSRGRIILLRLADVDWVEAKGNYVELHAGKRSYLIRETMKSFESKLDPRTFMRIHRSNIVNINRIVEMRPWFTGEYIVVLDGGKELTLTRSYRGRLQSLLDQ